MQAKPRKYFCGPETAHKKQFIQYLFIHLADRILWDSSFTCVCNIGWRWALAFYPCTSLQFPLRAALVERPH